MPSLSTLKLIGWAIAAFAFIACLAALRMEQAQNGKLKAQLHESTTLRAADRAAYERAQQEAADTNKAHVAAVEAQYKRNNDEAVATLNARLERLRRELSAHSGAPQGSAGRAGSPSPDDPAGASGEARVCIAAKDFLRAAENEERFDELITLILRQTKINPNTN